MLAAAISVTLVQQFPKVHSVLGVAMADTNEVTLFSRYLDLTRRPDAIMWRGNCIWFTCDAAERASVIKAFATDYGINFLDLGSDHRVNVPFPYVNAPFSDAVPVHRLLGMSESSSSLHKAIQALVDKGSIMQSDLLVSCTYRLRPWITRNLVATETVEGTVVVSRAERRVKLPFGPE